MINQRNLNNVGSNDPFEIYASSIKPTIYSLQNEKSSTDTNAQKPDFPASFPEIKLPGVNETKIVYHEIHCDYHAKQLLYPEFLTFSSIKNYCIILHKFNLPSQLNSVIWTNKCMEKFQK